MIRSHRMQFSQRDLFTYRIAIMCIVLALHAVVLTFGFSESSRPTIAKPVRKVAVQTIRLSPAQHPPTRAASEISREIADRETLPTPKEIVLEAEQKNLEIKPLNIEKPEKKPAPVIKTEPKKEIPKPASVKKTEPKKVEPLKKPVPVKQPAKPVAKTTVKPAPVKAAPVKTAPDPKIEERKRQEEKIQEEKRAELDKRQREVREKLSRLKEFKETNGKIASASGEQMKNSPALPERVSRLEIDSPASVNFDRTEGFGSVEATYRDKVHQLLQKALVLPAHGAVEIKLTLSKTGKVSKVEIVKSRNGQNSAYIQRVLPGLVFPSFDRSFENSSEYTFSVTLDNG